MDLNKFENSEYVYCIKDCVLDCFLEHKDYLFKKGNKYKSIFILKDNIVIIWANNNRPLFFGLNYVNLNSIDNCFITIGEYRQLKIKKLNL